MKKKVLIITAMQYCKVIFLVSFDLKNGIKVSKKSFEALVKEKSKTSQLIYLNNKGQDIRTFNFQENTTFVFGYYIGMPRKTEKLLDRLSAKKINLSPKMLFASHCIIIVHNELDIQKL